MSAFFLYHGTTAPTGRVLAECLRLPHGSTPPDDRQDLLIRWGNRASVRLQAGFTLNPRRGIIQAGDKLGSLDLMRGAGVMTPDYGTSAHHTNLPVLARMRNHTRGQDIRLCMNMADVATALREGSEYIVEYIPTAREYRARVVGDRCVRVSEKVLREAGEYVQYCRNYETGWVFMQPRVRLNAFQEAMAVAAVRALGLHFGAVDLVVGDDGHTYILEVNTAPALAKRSAQAMIGGMVDLIRERTGLELDPMYSVLDQLESPIDDGDTEDVEAGDESCPDCGAPDFGCYGDCGG